MPTIGNIFPEYIRLDGGTQLRAKIDQAVCDEYGERMKVGEKFPAIDVFFDGQSYWLVDGCHRLRAHCLARPGEAITCRVFQGSLREAQWHSYGVNKTHGLRRSNADKERTVRAAVAHPMAADKSNRQIAQHCGVSERMVRKYRAFRDGISPVPVSKIRTVTRAGRTYQLDTTRIGRTKQVGCTVTPSRCMTGRIMRPTGTPTIAQKMVTLGMPRDPFRGAMLLIDLFDAKYLRTLVDIISNHLKNA